MTIFITSKIDILPDKRRELLQTAVDVVKAAQNEKGCVSTGIYQDIANRNSLCIIWAWKTLDDHNRYMTTSHFKALKWAIRDMTRAEVIWFGQETDHENVFEDTIGYNKLLED